MGNLCLYAYDIAIVRRNEHDRVQSASERRDGGCKLENGASDSSFLALALLTVLILVCTMYVFPATYVVVRINFFRIQEHEPYSPSKMLKFRKDEFDILTPNGIMNGSELLASTQPQY